MICSEKIQTKPLKMTLWIQSKLLNNYDDGIKDANDDDADEADTEEDHKNFKPDSIYIKRLWCAPANT